MPEPNKKQISDILTVDFEEWYHILDDEPIDPARWEKLPTTIETDTLSLLDILDRFGAKATFFVVGWLARRTPDLVREIVRRGHTLGTHGYLHIPPEKMTETEFRSDLIRSIEVIEWIAHVYVRGYRAPGFGIRQCRFDYLKVLRDYGLSYDASLFPGAFPGRTHPCAFLYPYPIDSPGEPFWEVPVSAQPILSVPVAFSGGGFLRLLPEWFIRWSSHRVHRRGDPVVYYLHPRDINPATPMLPAQRWKQFQYYGGRSGLAWKLESILEASRCTSIEAFLAEGKEARSA